jgi:class 3 adenylate cyclase/pimeloyl-ACP methyl ester carboxylesterase
MSRRLATILSLDVVGYSSLMQHDPSGLLRRLNEIFQSFVLPNIKLNNGRVVKLLGDGALIEFSSAYDGLCCASRIQNEIRTADPQIEHDGQPILLRAGLHAGDVISEGEDVFGDGVNIAARLQSEAEAGGVLLSSVVAQLAGGDLPFRLRREGSRKLKNIAYPIDTFSIDMSDQQIRKERHHRAQSLEINFCRAANAKNLAWTALGDGPPVVKTPNWISHLELEWRHPGHAHLFGSIAERHRFVYFDARGNGLSDWEIGNINFDMMVDDLEAVFDAAGVERAPILAISQGCAIAVAFAARSPERVSGIVMMGSYPLGRGKRESQKDRKQAKALQGMLGASWEDDSPSLRDLIADMIVPQASQEDRRQFAEDMREMIHPKTLEAYRKALDDIDVTHLLPKVLAPCLIFHGNRDRMQPIEQGRKMAAGIPNSKFISLDTNNHVLTENDPCWPLFEREMHTFLDKLA